VHALDFVEFGTDLCPEALRCRRKRGGQTVSGGDRQGDDLLDERGQFDVGELQGRDIRQSQRCHRGHLELQEDLAGLVAVEVGELDLDRVRGDLLGGEVVVEPDELDRGLALRG
jgi:hypothetical protein